MSMDFSKEETKRANDVVKQQDTSPESFWQSSKVVNFGRSVALKEELERAKLRFDNAIEQQTEEIIKNIVSVISNSYIPNCSLYISLYIDKGASGYFIVIHSAEPDEVILFGASDYKLWLNDANQRNISEIEGGFKFLHSKLAKDMKTAGFHEVEVQKELEDAIWQQYLTEMYMMPIPDDSIDCWRFKL